ncbi:MAG: flagellar hook protein FlgE [Treponema sp.]|jgi:flagellar hook protein FlgE|nr:flagellar hook protein FlgE [Treponema sp.]
MMRSLYSGVSGLQNHQTRMDVVGNNIANVNTYGFKKGRVNFQDMIYQQLAGAARPTEDLGGINPKEVGLGMSVASIDTIHLQGSLQSTGVQTDLAISGTGFFILKSGDSSFYTRDGSFGLDNQGTLVDPANGLRVQGWMTREVDGVPILDVSRDVEDLVIPVGSKDPARATTRINFACNLDKRLPQIPEENPTPGQISDGTWRTAIDVYDSFGDVHTMQVEFTRVPGVNNSWNATVIVDPQSDPPTNAAIGLGADAPAVGGPNVFTVTFDNNGLLLSAADGAGNESGGEGQITMNVAYDVLNTTPGEDGAPVRQLFALDLGNVGGYTRAITQFADQSSSKAVEQDGYGMGYLDNFKIDQNGIITGVFSNGTNRTLGQVALASFANQGGLEKAGENTFVVSTNSGIANVGPARVAGKGKIIAATLEMSNVDLADQFVDMIVTQRGFQANSRTIQTADQMLQELLTLKR